MSAAPDSGALVASARQGGHHEHFESGERQQQAAHLGTWIFLGSETLLFAALFGVYAGYRVEFAHDFARAAAHNDATIGTVNTLVLITSSYCAARAVRSAHHEHWRGVSRWLAATLVLAALFLVFKAVEWSRHFREGILPGRHYHYEALPASGANAFYTLYYLLTGLHALHVIGGMCALGVVLFSALRFRKRRPRETLVELVVLYWHLVDVIWIFLWPLLYLVR